MNTSTTYTSHRTLPDSLTMDEFDHELRRTVRADAIAAVDDPLAAVLLQIEQQPLHLQSRLLTRILSALTFGVGPFRQSELFTLDRSSRTLALALANARAAGSAPLSAWEAAVDAAGTAQLATSG